MVLFYRENVVLCAGAFTDDVHSSRIDVRDKKPRGADGFIDCRYLYDSLSMYFKGISEAARLVASAQDTKINRRTTG